MELRKYDFNKSYTEEIKSIVLSLIEFRQSALLDKHILRIDETGRYLEREKEHIKHNFAQKVADFVKIESYQERETGENRLEARLYLPYIQDEKIKELKSLIRMHENDKRICESSNRLLTYKLNKIKNISKLTLFLLKIIDPLKAHELSE